MLTRISGFGAGTLLLLLGLAGCGSGTPEIPPAPPQAADAADPNAVPPGMEPADPNLAKAKK